MAESSFEAQYQELEKIVERLESGKLPIEESLKLFKRGVELITVLRKRLTVVENEVKEITKKLEADSDDSS